MRPGTPGFVGARLTEAREALGVTVSALADLARVSRQAISQYENGTHSPSPEVLKRLSDALSVPEHRFLKPIRNVDRSPFFFRSMSTATKTARTRARRHLSRFQELTDDVMGLANLPAVNVPDLGAPRDPLQLSGPDLEDLAVRLRRAWDLGDGPISNMTWLLENNGIMVARVPLDAKTLDGLSAWIDGRPYVVINEDRPTVRARFDLAHELAHIILHRHVDDRTLNTSSQFGFIEKQAHRFAAAFAFPQASFARETSPISLEHFVRLKERWKVSIKMMIHRTGDLGLLPEERLTQLYKHYSWRRWSKNEPLDDKLLPERPRLLDNTTALIIDSGASTAADLVHKFALHEWDVCRLACPGRELLSPKPAAVLRFPGGG